MQDSPINQVFSCVTVAKHRSMIDLLVLPLSEFDPRSSQPRDTRNGTCISGNDCEIAIVF